MIQAHTSYQHPVCFCKTEQSAFDASNTILNLKIHHTRIKTCRRQYPIENPTKTPPYYHLRLHSFQAGSNHNMFQLENSLYSTSLFFTSKFLSITPNAISCENYLLCLTISPRHFSNRPPKALNHNYVCVTRSFPCMNMG